MEEKEKTTQEKNTRVKVQEEIDKLIKEVVEDGINTENLDYLYRLVDIHKDLANEDYWEAKKEGMNMRYRGYGESEMYGNYGEDSYGRRGRDSRGRYTEGGSYGRRGVKGTGRGRYRGEEMMDEMQFHYGNYAESGQYGAEEESTKALEAMMEATVEFIKSVKEEAKSPEEMQIIKHYSKKISEM